MKRWSLLSSSALQGRRKPCREVARGERNVTYNGPHISLLHKQQCLSSVREDVKSSLAMPPL